MTRVAFDMASFMQTALRGGTDDENGYVVEHEGKPVKINSHHHGYDKCIDYMLDVLKAFHLKPINTILAFEGMNQKGKRLMIDPSYKGNRGKSPQAYYDEMATLKSRLLQAWRDVGAIAVEQDLAEGDDTLAWLAQNTEEDLVVATYDNDLAALCGANAYGANITTWINGLIDVNKFGVFDYHLIPTYKALVGDSSDNIKGIPGFGAKAFEDFCNKYGYDGLAELQAMLLAGKLHPALEGMAETCKIVKKIVEHKADAMRCFELARLRPEWVDTMKNPLRWMPGKIRPVQQGDDPRLKPFLGRIKLITADNFEQAVEWARPHIEATVEVALDIEGSDADESDDWLEAQRSKGKAPGVDTFGSTLTGLSLTFGDNAQYTFYISVDHAETNNVPSESVRQLIASIPRRIPIVIQNTMYELPVLFNEWGAQQLDNDYHGFLPGVLDSLFEGSYVNENMPLGLKERSMFYLGYRQETYDEVTTLVGKPEDLPRGGKLLSTQYLYETVETGKMVPVDDPASNMLIPETKQRLVERETGEFETDDKGELVLKRGKPVPVKEPVVDTITRQYKMRELSARHVLGYGADDPICTIALHNFYKLHMQLEHHWQVYLDVEISAAYQHAKNFIDGVPMSQEELNRQIKEDDEVFAKAWATLRTYLMKKGWAGTEPPAYTRDITVAQIKEAYQIVTGEPLDTAMRTMSKLVTYIREVKDQPILATLLERMMTPEPVDPESVLLTEEECAPSLTGKDPKVESADIIRMREKAFTDYVRSKFSGVPDFNDGSTPQMCRLLYEVMDLPIRVRNKPTDIMRAKGINEGNPKADALAIAYALRDAEGDDEKVGVLKALQLMSMVGTRRSLYYEKYPHFPHWKDGKIHSQHKQCGANTRRATVSKPNLQQLPKHPKMEGYEARFRRVIVPHKPGAVVVSIDFDAQELRIIAERSQDPTALSMFVGDNLTKPHALTGLGIAMKQRPDVLWTYDMFMQIHKDAQHELHKFVKECYRLGKKLNFVAEYGAMAPKVAATLMVDEDEAQMFLDAREDMFPRVKEWKQEVIAFAKKHGYVLTMKGARRHLRDALMSEDRFEASKAERQAVNFEVQSPSAEQTKEAEGRMWERGLFFRYDAVCYSPVHDEIVMSVMIEDLVRFLPEAHACMAVQYADMKVPCLGSISFGANLFDQIEIGTEPTPEAIEKGLAKLRGEPELAEAA